MMLRAGVVACTMVVQMGCDPNGAKPQAAVEKNPEKPVSAENIEKSLVAAQTYLDSQEIVKAQAILATLIDRAPGEVRARQLYAESFMALAMQAQASGEAAAGVAVDAYRKAHKQYQLAVEIEPGNAGLHHSAGMVAIQAGQPSVALNHFQTAAKLDPSNPQYPLFAAQLLIQEKRFDEAEAALGNVLELDGDEAFAHASLAMVALEKNQFEAALAHMTEARRIQPADLGLRVQEAKIHRRRGDPQRGLQLLIGLSEAERATEMIAFEIASCYDGMGQPMKAAKAWQHVHQTNTLAPNAWLAAVRMGEYLLKAGEREQAALWLDQARFAAPNAPEVKALDQAIANSR